MLRALQNAKIASRVLCLTKDEAFESEISNLGIRVDWVGRSRNKLVRLREIISNFRDTRVDVIQSAHFYTNIYAALAGRVLGVESIGAIRNDLTSEIRANGALGRWQLNLPKRLIANSQLAVNRAVAIGIDRSKIALVKNAVAVDSDSGAGNQTNKVNILFAGRLVQQKRPELFIELAAALRELHAAGGLRFLIAGDGPLRASLEEMAKVRGLAGDEISFLGEQTNISDIYRMSDILVLTSKHEGTPNVVLEAMAKGLAVVATDVGGVREILPRHCGIIVDSRDLSGLVTATSILVLDRERRTKLGENGRAFVEKHHSICSLQSELTAVYSRISQ